MATPGIALLLSFLEPATIPASPPKKAIKSRNIYSISPKHPKLQELFLKEFQIEHLLKEL